MGVGRHKSIQRDLGREHYWPFEWERQLASIGNVSVTVYKITKTMGVVDPANAYNKDDQKTQLESSAETSNPLPMGGGDHMEVTANVIKQ